MKGLNKKDDSKFITEDEAREINVRVSLVIAENNRVSNLLEYYRKKCSEQAAVIDALRADVEFLSQFKPVTPAPEPAAQAELFS